MNDASVITTKGLKRRYGKRMAIDGLDLNVPKGSVYGLLGENGAGKTTTIRMLMGLIRRHGGSIDVLGMDSYKDDIEVKRRVGYVAETPGFYTWMKVKQIIRLVSAYHADWDYALSDRLLGEFHLDANKKIKALSKGMVAKLSLLMALSFKPEVLILDEPTTGLDPGARRELIESILRDYQEKGKTVFISSHLVNEIAGIVDFVGILRGGKLMTETTTQSLFDSVKSIRLTFPSGNVPNDVACKGMLDKKIFGGEALVTVRDFDGSETIAELKKFSPQDIAVENLALEDILIALVPSDEDA